MIRLIEMKENSIHKRKVLIYTAAISWIVLFLTLIIYQSLDTAINIPTNHLDGAFQTASGLFRIDSGQVPGRDFFPYLGVGPVLLIYPLLNIFTITLV